MVDKGYDSDPLRKKLKKRRIELICSQHKKSQAPKMGENSEDTDSDGRSSAPSRG
jgi:hypothetical protein